MLGLLNLISCDFLANVYLLYTSIRPYIKVFTFTTYPTVKEVYPCRFNE